MFISPIRLRICAVLFSFFSIVALHAQVSMTAVDTPVTQNFDSLANTGTANVWANNTTITGWYVAKGSAGDITTYGVNTGSSTIAGLYSFGALTATDRALGSAISNTFAGATPLGIHYAVRLANTTGAALTSVDVTFACEQWRNNGNVTAQKLAFEYQVATAGTVSGANTPTSGWTAVTSLDCTTPIATATASALDGNLSANRVVIGGNIPVSVPSGNELWLRWFDINDSGNDHILALDDFSVTPRGAVSALPALSINDVSVTEGNSGIKLVTFTVNLSAPAGVGGVTFDIATADGTATTANNDYVARSIAAQTIPEGIKSFAFEVTINGDTTPEPNENFFVNVTNVVGATVADAQGIGTIINDDFPITPINQIQGVGAASPLIGNPIATTGIVTAVYPGFRGFYIQTPDANADADPNTSEGIFVFVNSATLPADAVVGNAVQVSGVVAEFPAAPSTTGATQITGTVANPLLVTLLSAANPLPVPVVVSLPLASATALEKYEGMRVVFNQTLTVSGNFTLGRFGEVVLSSGGRLINPSNMIDLNDDPASGNTITGTGNLAAIVAALEANKLNQITLDDATSATNPDPTPFGVTAANSLRAGSTITGVAGIVNQIAQGYRVLSDPTNPPTFDRVPRPLAPPPVGGSTKAAGFNVLNYFNGNGSNVDGLAGGFPTTRGAKSYPEFVRQRAKIITAIDRLKADIVGVIEMENDGDTPRSALPDLLDGLGAADASALWRSVPLPASWGSIPGSTDQITTRLIYKNLNIEPVGAPLFCNNAAFDRARTPLAQVFRSRSTGGDVIVSINHFKSKSCGSGVDAATGLEADQNDGQGCWAPRRLQQAQALVACVSQWQSATGENKVLLLGDFNAYEQENAIDAFRAAALVPLINDSYSFVFDAASGSLDHAIATPQLVSKVTGASKWHINADEPISLDYSLEFKSPAQQTSLYAPDPFRSSDHDPALVGMALGGASACKLDIDGDGAKLAAIDGLIAVRAMLGMGAASVGSTTFPAGATRSDWTAINNYLNADCGTSNPLCSLDIDGDGIANPLVDGLIIVRALLGFTDASVVGDLTFPAAAPRKTWADIRGFLVDQCSVTIP